MSMKRNLLRLLLCPDLQAGQLRQEITLCTLSGRTVGGGPYLNLSGLEGLLPKRESFLRIKLLFLMNALKILWCAAKITRRRYMSSLCSLWAIPEKKDKTPVSGCIHILSCSMEFIQVWQRQVEKGLFRGLNKYKYCLLF